MTQDGTLDGSKTVNVHVDFVRECHCCVVLRFTHEPLRGLLIHFTKVGHHALRVGRQFLKHLHRLEGRAQRLDEDTTKRLTLSDLSDLLGHVL